MGYYADLLARLRSDEELPQSGTLKSSEDTVSWRAHREAEANARLDDLEELEAFAAAARVWRDFSDAAFVASHLFKNTGAAGAKDLLLALCANRKLSKTNRHWVVDGLRRAKLPEGEPFARAWLSEADGPTLASLLEYFAIVIGRPALPVLIDALDADCSGKTEPMSAVFGIQYINHPDGIPALERAIARHRTGRKGWQNRTVAYSRRAIEAIQAGTGVTWQYP